MRRDETTSGHKNRLKTKRLQVSYLEEEFSSANSRLEKPSFVEKKKNKCHFQTTFHAGLIQANYKYYLYDKGMLMNYDFTFKKT